MESAHTTKGRTREKDEKHTILTWLDGGSLLLFLFLKIQITPPFIMRAFPFDEMIPQLLFVTGNGNNRSVVKSMKRSSRNRAFSEMFLSGVDVDIDIFNTIVDILNSRKWNGIHMAECTGLIPELIEAVSPLVEKLSILGDFWELDSCCCQSLSRGLRLPNTRLEKLMLRVQLSNDLSMALEQSLSSRHCRIEELIVPISNSGKNGNVTILSKALQQSKTLKALKINRQDNMDTTKDEDRRHPISTLWKSLEDHPSLQELSIPGDADFGIETLAEDSGVLVQSLQKLDLSNHRFNGDPLPGIQSIARRLSSSPNSLEYLSISGHSLSRMDVMSLADALSHPQHARIEELHMNNCNLDDDCIIAFAKRLPAMKTLKRLFLHDNPFGKTAAAALAEGMRHNCEIEHFVLPRKARKATQVQQIELYLALNRAGRRLLKAKDPIPLSMWPDVLHRAGETLTPGKQQQQQYSNSSCIHRNDVLYHLLQGPALLER
eukprot:scaffold7641_cov115-Cylindrotheca_fusiformis.AAC.31